MKITKNNKQKQDFDITKIIAVLQNANQTSKSKIDNNELKDIAVSVSKSVEENNSTRRIEELVQKELIERKHTDLARAYIQGCYDKKIYRNQSNLDKSILKIISNSNRDVASENSNKDPVILSTQRDYIAGEVSKDIADKFLWSKDIVKAHHDGLIHLHDRDYAVQKITNCGLVNFEDILNNGTVISKIQIDKPKSLKTASTVLTQCVAVVASSQYGGQTFTLSHLAPFVDISRQKIKKMLVSQKCSLGLDLTEEQIDKMVELELKNEIKDSIQTINYQLSTIQSTNGQSPFVTVFLNLSELEDKPREQEDLALLIEELLRQRIIGVKNQEGVFVPLAFPKLIYALDENNIHEDSKFFWLTELAAECTAKCMVPDYISAKKMRELKQGDVYPAMGCLDYNETITINDDTVCKIGKFYDIISRQCENTKCDSPLAERHDEKSDCYDLIGRNITAIVKDVDGNYTRIQKVMRNANVSNWVELQTENKTILLTTDHPLLKEIGSKDSIKAGELRVGDYILNDQDEKETIIKVTPVERTTYSYDIETETHTFVFSGVQSHNCRSFLTPREDHKYFGRFNLGVVTLNLPDVALSSKGNIQQFWNILDERLELAKKALLQRVDYMKTTPSDVAPLLWQYGAYARLKQGETIEKLFYDNYATISIGYAGLYEAVRYMTDCSHTDEEAKPFALSVMRYMKEFADRARDETGISFSLYGTPLESSTYRLAKCLQKRFGIIEGVTDHLYITNSYHVNVREEIDAFSKLKIESEFQELSPGGAISYVEVPNLANNIPAVIAIIQYIYDNIMYAELNCKIDHCYECGFRGEIKGYMGEDGKPVWECPHCHNTDQNKMRVLRRTCGYLGANYWCDGRSAEIFDRVLHL